jgi:hypothetical protein
MEDFVASSTFACTVSTSDELNTTLRVEIDAADDHAPEKRRVSSNSGEPARR